jgi:hypothetical protein
VTQITLTGVLDDGTQFGPEVPTRTGLTVKFARGETVKITLNLVTNAGLPVYLEAGDRLKLTWERRLGGFGCGTVIKMVAIEALASSNKYEIALLPDDTKIAEPGRYLYDVWLEKAGGDRFQVVRVSDLQLMPAPGTGAV